MIPKVLVVELLILWMDHLNKRETLKNEQICE